MQEARRQARLIALALLVPAGAAHAAPEVLPLATVDNFLRSAGIATPWSVQQTHLARAPALWVISAFADRRALGPSLCTSRLVELELVEQGGALSIARTDDRVEYAFSPCEWSLPEEYHEIRGAVDPERLERDFAIVASSIRGAPPKDVKLVFASPAYRAAFATLRRTDIQDVNADENGHLRMCFVSDLVDAAGAIETLSVDVVPGKVTEVKVGLCGVIETGPARK